VAAIVAERSRVLVVDETLGKIRRAEPLPDFDLEDIQARTVVAENLGAEPTVEGVAKAFALDVVAENASTNDDVQKTNDVSNENVPNAAIKNTNATRSVPPSMVRVRHPGMQTPAGVCAATTGLDLVRVASGATHALIEYETRELAELAVRLKNDDKDWRHGLRVRLLVKNVKAAAKKKKQREERAQRDEGEEAEAEAEADTEKTDKEKTSETSAETGPETAPVSASKKKGKHKKGKRDYSQWASAAAFKENKQTFLTEGEDGGVGTAGDAAADGAAPGAESVAPLVSSAPPRAPTMPDGTRGFAFGAATGKPRRAFPPGVPTEPKKTEAAEAERLAPETAEETRSSE
jgi:La-related protein 7